MAQNAFFIHIIDKTTGKLCLHQGQKLAKHIPFHNQCIICQENVYNGAYHLIAAFVYFALQLVLIHSSMNEIKSKRIGIFYTKIVAESVSTHTGSPNAHNECQQD